MTDDLHDEGPDPRAHARECGRQSPQSKPDSDRTGSEGKCLKSSLILAERPGPVRWDCPVCNKILVVTPGLLPVLELVHRIAKARVNVNLWAPTGAGKELIARLVHEHSDRATRGFAAVHLAAVAESLVESELFGSRKGAFSGATDRSGLIEQVDGGTLLLDEIADAPFTHQTKLLRVLQERSVCRVGEARIRHVDFRLVTATHGDLRACVAAGTLREDFFYRIRGVEIRIPPLRDRPQDVPYLVFALIDGFSELMRCPPCGITRAGMARLVEYDWPGNVRELKITVEQAVELAQGQGVLDACAFDLAGTGTQRQVETVTKRSTQEFSLAEGRERVGLAERQNSRCKQRPEEYQRFLELARDGKLDVREVCAELNIDRSTFYRWCAECGVALNGPAFKERSKERAGHCRSGDAPIAECVARKARDHT